MVARAALRRDQTASSACRQRTSAAKCFRAMGITTQPLDGGTIENAPLIAGRESLRTTKIYDRRNDEITLDEIERLVI